MSRSKRTWLLLLLGSAVTALFLLSGALSSLTLAAGRPLALELGRLANQPAPDPTWLLAALIAVYALIVLVLLPSRWRRSVWFYLPLALILLGLGGVWLLRAVARMQLDPEAVRLAAQTARPTPAPADAIDALPDPALAEGVAFVPPPAWVGLLVSFGVALVLFLVLGAIAAFLWQRQRQPEAVLEQGPLAQLAQQAQATLHTLRRGGDLRDAVIRCYVEMGRVLAETQNIRRPDGMTPREFEGQLTALGLPPEPVAGLTRLFEEVRYGGRVAAAEEERRAIASLSAIVAFCQRAA